MADSQKLFFDWRKPGEKEASTYVVGRDGGEARRLSDAEGKDAPAANGRWDKAHQRLRYSDGGDVVIHEGASGERIQVTRTTGTESNARWARNDTHVTYVRDGNLFIVPRLTDSQKFIRVNPANLRLQVKCDVSGALR